MDEVKLKGAKLKEYIDRYIRFNYRAWRPKTKKNNENWEKNLLGFIGDKFFNRDTAEEYFAFLKQKGIADSSLLQAETFVKKIVKWMYEEEMITKDWASRIVRTQVKMKLRILPDQKEALELIGKATEPGKYDCKQHRFSKKEHRDCLRFILVACGGRNFETRSILRSDVSISGRQIQINNGKTGPRMVSVPEVPWLIKNLEERVKGWTPEALKILSDKSRYKATDVDRLFVVNEKKLEETMRKAGNIWGHPLQVHDLRRIFARDQKKNGAQDSDIKNLMGHKRFETTEKYLEYDSSALQRAINSYSSEARKYRTKDEKVKEFIDKAMEIGQVVYSKTDGQIISVKIRVA